MKIKVHMIGKRMYVYIYIYSNTVTTRFHTSISGMRTRRSSQPTSLVNQFQGCTRVSVNAFRNRFRLNGSEKDLTVLKFGVNTPDLVSVQSVLERCNIHL